MFFLICPIKVCGLAKVAIFTTNIHTKHTLQIYDKPTYKALNRHFCQTAVIASGFATIRIIYKLEYNYFSKFNFLISKYSLRVST